MPYISGDENYDLQELMSASLAEYLPEDPNGIMTFPNPFRESVQIEFKEPFESGDLLSIYSSAGDFICKLNPLIGTKELIWDGKIVMEKIFQAEFIIFQRELRVKYIQRNY